MNDCKRKRPIDIVKMEKADVCSVTFLQVIITLVLLTSRFQKALSILTYSFVIAGQHPPYRAIGLGQRPFLETPFSHLRELELDLFKKQGVRTSQSADGLNSYKQESQGQFTFAIFLELHVI
nr:unnamed protein product [Callosobruchus analis]